MTKNYNKKLYDCYVDTQLADKIDRVALKRNAFSNKVVKKFFPKNKNCRILELGCGHGSLIHEATQAEYTNIFGVDASPQQIKLANSYGISCVIQGDALSVLKGAEANTFDLIVAIDLFEHLEKKELINYLDEVRRVLKVGGSLLFRVPNGSSPFCGNILYGDYTHVQAFTESSISQLLRSSEYSDIKFFEDSPIVHGLISGIRRMIWELIRISMGFIMAVESGVINKIFTKNIICVTKK